MNGKCLLLNQDGSILGFIEPHKAIRLICKEKVATVSVWQNDRYRSISGYCIDAPAILQMRYYVMKRHTKVPFSRKAVFKRDRYTCGYCLKVLTANSATMDHIIAKKHGGANSFQNCVTSCQKCNSRKSHSHLGDTDLVLINRPFVPTSHSHYLADDDNRHPDWERYL